MRHLVAITLVFAACGPAANRGGGGDDAGSTDASLQTDASGNGDGNTGSSYLVYAHSDTVLYSIDLSTKSLVTVGNFNAPLVMTTPDVITDLAVAPDGTIYVVSETALYTASTMDGHVTRVASLSTCGTRAVALTTTSDGKLYVGDFMGAICQIDISMSPPVVRPPVMMQGGLALSGDMVGLGDGSVYGTAYKLTDGANVGTQMSNLLVKVNVTTGAVTQLGASGFPKLFGVAFQENKFFGFTHDGTGRVVTLDPMTGAGTVFATFIDPGTNKGIYFAGAGVNSLIVIE